jgi:hypothetical protein
MCSVLTMPAYDRARSEAGFTAFVTGSSVIVSNVSAWHVKSIWSTPDDVLSTPRLDRNTGSQTHVM